MGYLKSRSTVSLASGSISGLLLLVLAGLIYSGFSWAKLIAAGIISVLIIVFIIRWFKTKKLIPALPMIFCGFISLVIVLS
ncbi:small integral membrane protein [Xenococcus sp. PCC 7305]|nr:small integral membrane protein [Xenococcus sp. PCC 7305]